MATSSVPGPNPELCVVNRRVPPCAGIVAPLTAVRLISAWTLFAKSLFSEFPTTSLRSSGGSGRFGRFFLFESGWFRWPTGSCADAGP
jgi:hypothetical protein